MTTTATALAAAALARTRALHAACSVRFTLSFPLAGGVDVRVSLLSASRGVTIGKLQVIPFGIALVPLLGFNLDDAVSVHVASLEIDDVTTLAPVVPLALFFHPNQGPFPVPEFSVGIPISDPPPAPGSPDRGVAVHAVIFDVRAMG